MKKIILGVVVLLIVIIFGGNYYTGSKIEEVVPQQLSLLEQSINNSLKRDGVYNTSVKFVPKLHKEFFKSTGEIEAIIFRNGAEVYKVILDADIYNGPFPLNKLKFLNFAPKMFSGELSLDKNKNPFIESEDRFPVTAVSSYSYSKDIDIDVSGKPLKIAAFSILNDWDMDLSQSDEEKTAEFKLGDIAIDNEEGKLKFKNFDLDSVFNSVNKSNSTIKIDEAIFTSNDDSKSKIVIKDFDIKYNTTDDNKADVRMDSDIRAGSFEATNNLDEKLKVWDKFKLKFNIPYVDDPNLEANFNKYLDRDIIVDKFQINNDEDKFDLSLILNINSNYEKKAKRFEISKIFNKLELNLDFTQNILFKFIKANKFIDGDDTYVNEDSVNQGISYLISNGILVKKDDGALKSHIRAKNDGFELNGKDISNFELLKYAPMY